jgi:hypothetical protein
MTSVGRALTGHPRRTPEEGGVRRGSKPRPVFVTGSEIIHQVARPLVTGVCRRCESTMMLGLGRTVSPRDFRAASGSVRLARRLGQFSGTLLERDPGGGSPGLPEASHPPSERRGRLGVDTLADVKRLTLQLRAAMADQLDDGVEINANIKTLRGQDLAKDPEVMVVSQ